MTNSTSITCPNCNHVFSIENALTQSFEEHFREEIEKRVMSAEKKAAEEARKIEQRKADELKQQLEVQNEVLRRENIEKTESLKKSLRTEVEFLELQRKFKEQADMNDAVIKKHVLENQQELLSKFELEKKQMQQQVESITNQLEEAKKKANQASQQLVGEVQELAIEEYLRNEFKSDTIEEISKGQRGADCIHVVMNGEQRIGSVYYESKRTRSFSNDWIDKLKSDMRMKGADVGVIVTETMPKELERLGQVNGVWVCSFTEFKSLCHVLREMVWRVGRVAQTQVNKADKMSALYDYLVGSEFRMQIEAMVEGFVAMREDLARERTAMEKLWKQREKQLEKVLFATAGMHGSIKGIAGSDVGSIGLLEL